MTKTAFASTITTSDGTDQPSPLRRQWQGHMADDIGATFGPEPCATLEADASTLQLRSTRGNFSIPRQAVVSIGRGGLYPWFFRGIRLRHRQPGIPTHLQFKPMHSERGSVVDALASLGYPAR